MEIVAIVIFALVGTVLLTVLRESRPEFALILTILTGLLLFRALAPKLAVLVGTLRSIAGRAEVGSLHLDTLLKVIGVAYISEFGAQVCRDSQAEAVAGKVELAGKVIIMALAVPVVLVILDTILRLLP